MGARPSAGLLRAYFKGLWSESEESDLGWGVFVRETPRSHLCKSFDRRAPEIVMNSH